MRENKLNQAYLIHARPFRETSLLLDFFTKEQGFIKAIARGARTSSKNNKRGLLQPFMPLLINWRGNSELVTLNNIELAKQPLNFSSKTMAIGFYLNELLYYLLNKYSGLVMEELFNKYELILDYLGSNFVDSNSRCIEIKLREFELDLLDHIGYGLQFSKIISEYSYNYNVEQGFYQASSGSKASFSGEFILKLQERDWQNTETMRLAKVLLRYILQCHLGGKELHSRKLFLID